MVMGALAQGAGALTQAGANAFFTGQANKKARKFTEHMYNRQRADALADFHMQNEYNSPAAQMKRLKDAGLNPNLVYDNGAAMANAAPIRNTDAGSWKPEAPQIDLSGLGDAYMNYFRVKNLDQQTDNLQAQKTVMDEEAKLKVAQTLATYMQAANTEQNTTASKFDLSQRQRLADISFQAAVANVQKTLSDINFTNDSNRRANELQPGNVKMQQKQMEMMNYQMINLATQSAKTAADRQKVMQDIKTGEFEQRIKAKHAELWEAGLNPADPAWMRILETYVLKWVENKKEADRPGFFESLIKQETSKNKKTVTTGVKR